MPATATLRTRVPRWRRRPLVRSEEILRSALTVFASAGYAGAQLEAVARGAGVSKATLYLYFDSKAALFRATVYHATRDWLPPEPAAAGFFPESAQKKLRRILRHAWTILRQPTLTEVSRLISAERERFPELAAHYFKAVFGQLRDRLAPVLEAGSQRGDFRAEATAIALEVLPVWLVQQTVLAPELSGAAPDPARFFEASLDLLLQGLYSRRERSTRG